MSDEAASSASRESIRMHATDTESPPLSVEDQGNMQFVPQLVLIEIPLRTKCRNSRSVCSSRGSVPIPWYRIAESAPACVELGARLRGGAPSQSSDAVIIVVALPCGSRALGAKCAARAMLLSLVTGISGDCLRATVDVPRLALHGGSRQR